MSEKTPPMTDAPATTGLKERCKTLADKLARDAMLRQNSPVDTILEFVVSEIERSTEMNVAMARSRNYVANDDTFPSEVTFANGRRVRINVDTEGLACLEVETIESAPHD